MPKIRRTKNFIRKRILSPSKFDKRSFRIVDVGRPEHHKIIVGCEKGHYHPSRPKGKKCDKGLKIQAIIERR